MKIKVITTAALLTLGSITGLSQLNAEDAPPPPPAKGERGPGGPGGGPRMGPGERMEAIAKALGLSEEQKAKVQEVYKAEAKELRDLRQNDELSREEKFAKMKEIHESYKPKVRALLTPEQIAKLDKWEAEHPGFGGGKGDRPGRGERKGRGAEGEK